MNKPKLLFSIMSKRVYIVTSYKDLGDGRIEAKTKHDVTDEFLEIVEKLNE